MACFLIWKVKLLEQTSRSTTTSSVQGRSGLVRRQTVRTGKSDIEWTMLTNFLQMISWTNRHLLLKSLRTLEAPIGGGHRNIWLARGQLRRFHSWKQEKPRGRGTNARVRRVEPGLVDRSYLQHRKAYTAHGSFHCIFGDIQAQHLAQYQVSPAWTSPC